MEVNIENMRTSIELLDNFFANKNTDNLANVKYPRHIIYKSNEWLIYIFYSCLLDYGMRSKIYHTNLIQTYNLHPNIFNPHYVVLNYSNNQDELLTIIRENIHPRYPNIALKKWLNLSTFLSEFPNILDIIEKMKSFEELNAFIKNINGYGQKTGGLLLRLIMDAHICEFNDLKTIPLDRHDIEISYLNGIINKTKLTEKEICLLSKNYIDESKSFNVSASQIDKYLWEIGNRFCNKRDCLNCPLSKNCKKKVRDEDFEKRDV